MISGALLTKLSKWSLVFKGRRSYMKILKVTSMLGVSMVFSLCLLAQAGAQEGKGYKVFSAVELKKMQESDKEMLIIDTLPHPIYKEGHIPGAKNFEFPDENMDSWIKSKTAGKSRDDFAALLGKDKDRPLFFYCFDET
jgi:rhodanese-related sulfurtransferase